MKTWLAFWSGIFKNNPTFRLVLGLCPTLAVTTSLENALGMGLAASFVLVCSNGLVSALRKVIPAAVHIPCYIVIIATFVTAVDLLMQAYLPALSESLGIFIPLIVVNCIILGRAEAFACKNGVVESLADGLGTGVGFTLALALVAAVREILGAGSLCGATSPSRTSTPTPWCSPSCRREGSSPSASCSRSSTTSAPCRRAVAARRRPCRSTSTAATARSARTESNR